MSIITLTTDFGIKDHFVAVAKGKLLSLMPNCQIIDVSHNVDFYNITNASYIINGVCDAFPKDTIHIVCVDAELYEVDSFVALHWNEQYFLAPNNGILGVLTEQYPADLIVELEVNANAKCAMDVFVQTASKISNGDKLENLGNVVAECVTFVDVKPIVSNDENSIRGTIVYEDHYGNAVINVSKRMFNDIGKGRNFRMSIGSRYKISRINNYYSDFNLEVKSLKDYEGDALLIFNELDFLQLSLYKSNPVKTGSVKSLLGLTYRDSVTIEFETKEQE
ncbi:S-adenosyl-l-methionine hydroxide adenosyltransferase family protein [Flavobacterium sp. I3-2]|uniref:SAM hydrolase/SAM-dependent halogenase family protein n=1 Tax=Flavobacterium sp. I3-2 TaxID=2748319 RepID=UPI0015A9742E|nr:SAM-dependent chlorinase/fluorinase [Flavobacterium sp. I3-2]